MIIRRVALTINGAVRFAICAPEEDSLSDVLRRVGLTGTKIGCNVGLCGACSVIFNGKLIRSCVKKMNRSAPLMVRATLLMFMYCPPCRIIV